jgi:hypothetical protein
MSIECLYFFNCIRKISLYVLQVIVWTDTATLNLSYYVYKYLFVSSNASQHSVGSFTFM